MSQGQTGACLVRNLEKKALTLKELVSGSWKGRSGLPETLDKALRALIAPPTTRLLRLNKKPILLRRQKVM